VFDEADRIVETGHFPEVEKIVNFIQQKNENFNDLNSTLTTPNTETQPNDESVEQEKRLLTTI
jgi:superfamily II DNA/RNA helicase